MMPANTKQAKELVSEYKKAKDATVMGINVDDGHQTGGLAATYGTPEATTLDARMHLITALTGTPPTIAITPNEEDFEIIKRRGEAKKQLEFDEYITKKYRLTSPDANPYMFDKIKQEYPEYFQRRLDYIKEQDKIRQRELMHRTLGTRDLQGVYYEFMKDNDPDFKARVDESVVGMFGTDSALFGTNKLKNGLFSSWESWQQKMGEWLGMGYVNPEGITKNTTNVKQEVAR